ncbi:MAG: DNA polymerase I [Proteobacteria bacterium]|nr:MAG: DNA polymerase I [Pseudomonadota bacterium]
MNSKKLVLVDGSWYLYRAFYAVEKQGLTNSKGFPTGAILVVTRMMEKLREQHKPDFFGVVFDPKGKTLREDWYPEYKANRSPMPDDLRAQVEPIFDILRALGYPLVIVDHVEADDVIGTLARQAAAENIEVIISTGDKDMAQLVNEHIRLINSMDNIELDIMGVVEKFGVRPDQIIDYLTLTGDKVDNIPGVNKVGPVTAAKWLKKYDDLDQLIANAAEISGKIGDNLRAAIDDLPLSKRLVTIIDDIELEVTVDDLTLQERDGERLVRLFREFEFDSWLKQLGAVAQVGAVTSSDETEIEYETILDEGRLDSWIGRLEDAEYFAFDTETTSLNYIEAKIVGLSFSVKPGSAAYVPIGHDYPGAPVQLGLRFVLERMRHLLEDPTKPKLGHHLKYDRNVLLNHDIELNGIEFDTMLESYVLNSVASRHDLDTLVLKHLGRKTIHYEDVAGKGAKQIGFNEVAIEKATPYAAEDAEACLCLHRVLISRLGESSSLLAVFHEVEMPLVPVLSRIERRGVLVDAAMLAAQSDEIKQRLNELEARAHDCAGEVFNIGSPKQIQTILFEKLGLPVKAKTPTGQPSTAEAVLAELADDYPLPKLILEYRGLSKLKSTYTDKLPLEISPVTGRIHTSYHQAVAATGRLSSSDPNLQNIPIRTAEGRRIRRAFIAPPGRVLIAADYSQIELRIMAHLSQDSRLLESFRTGRDVHRATAAEILGIAPDVISNEQRRAAKAVNFGLIYGMSAFGLARQLGIDRSAAQAYIELYFARYPGVKAFMAETKERARANGFVETEFGRRLYVPEIDARNAQRRQYAERTAINAPLQGTAADIIKRAMIAVDTWIERDKVPATLIMQVHDELVFEVDEDVVDTTIERVCELMVGAANLSVPLVVEVGRGANWDEAH